MQNTQPERAEHRSNPLASIIGSISGLIASEHFPNGDRAALKRMNPKKEPPLSFYRFAFRHLPQNWQGQRKAWQAILTGMALMSPHIHNLKQPLGKVLAEEHFSEARLERLLAAEGETRRTLTLRAVRFLAAKKRPVNWVDVAGLLLTSDAERREKLHLCIAGDYYKNFKEKE
ncbi:type I-E CRISPR-associated protein Cse2/CasB [endosymbiont of Lamellibrachia barhami]|uniref:type I-E CRISPR-associated protein Cse2/CasB n=1 Tax=endosymbiont of Lamellibrachia barhami TaxID=205975 RepID=UPI0015AAF0FA|nr:type I-E CRISPR-associated protein Cse2/CasB [endosymbiont of Lamellibrachia barhami]